MTYRFVKVTTFYDNYIDQVYSKNANLRHSSYYEQYNQVMGGCFGWADFFSRNLRKLGKESFEIVANIEPMQKAWAKENDVNVKWTWKKDIVLHQLKYFQPDVIFFQDSLRHNGSFIDIVRQEVPSVKLVIGWLCAPYSDEHIDSFRAFDFMVTCNYGFPAVFSEYGIRMYQMYHGFEKSVMSKLDGEKRRPSTDVAFFGSLYPGEGYHNRRIEILEELVNSGVDVKIYGELLIESGLVVLLKQILFYIVQLMKVGGLGDLVRFLPILKRCLLWREVPRRSKLSKNFADVCQGGIYGIEMLQELSRSKIGVNVHIDAAGRYAGNARLFEATGLGVCLVTDWKENLGELFEVGKEVVAFRTPDECVEKIIWLLENPDDRYAIAKAGQERTLRDHTLERRAAELDRIIRLEMCR